MRTCIHVFLHELRKVLSDRKLLGSIFLMPLVIVFMTSFLSAGEPQMNADQQAHRIYVLNNMLPQQEIDQGIELVPVAYHTFDELESAVELGPEDAVLEITQTNTTVYYHSANMVSQNLSAICKQLVMDHMLADFAQTNMVDVSSRISVTDVNENADAGNFLGAILFPYMLVLLLFQSTSEYAVESIAGEKERGVFSKLLVAPVMPAPVIGGKLLSSTVCGVLSTAVYLFVVVASAAITGKDAFGLYETDFTPQMILLLVICALLLSCFFAGLSILCSLCAKTVKEAQSMKLPVYGVTMVLALGAMLRVGPVSELLYAIPIYNICIVMQDVLSSAVEVTKVLITLVSLGVCTALTVLITALLSNQEAVRC